MLSCRTFVASLVLLVPAAPAFGQVGKDLGDAAKKVKPRFVYEQTTGEFYLLQNDQKTPIGKGYSGKGEGLNNSDMQGVRNVGPIPQGVFLVRLGLFQRTGQVARANPQLAVALMAAAQRLAEPAAMGRLFKAFGFGHPSLPPPPGFTA